MAQHWSISRRARDGRCWRDIATTCLLLRGNRRRSLENQVRVEVYIPDLPADAYRNLLRSFEEEFTYAFGGCTIVSGLGCSYLSKTGTKVPDRINLIYEDLPLALSTNFDHMARYPGELREVSLEALSEESVLVAATQAYHAV